MKLKEKVKMFKGMLKNRLEEEKYYDDEILVFNNLNELYGLMELNCPEIDKSIIESRNIEQIKDYFENQIVFLDDKIYLIQFSEMARRILNSFDYEKEDLVKLLARELKQDFCAQNHFELEKMTYEYYYFFDSIILQTQYDLIKIDRKDESKTRKLNFFEVLNICDNVDKIKLL